MSFNRCVRVFGLLRLDYLFLAICGVGYPLTIIFGFNKVVVVVTSVPRCYHFYSVLLVDIIFTILSNFSLLRFHHFEPFLRLRRLFFIFEPFYEFKCKEKCRLGKNPSPRWDLNPRPSVGSSRML